MAENPRLGRRLAHGYPESGWSARSSATATGPASEGLAKPFCLRRLPRASRRGRFCVCEHCPVRLARPLVPDASCVSSRTARAMQISSFLRPTSHIAARSRRISFGRLCSCVRCIRDGKGTIPPSHVSPALRSSMRPLIVQQWATAGHSCPLEFYPTAKARVARYKRRQHRPEPAVDFKPSLLLLATHCHHEELHRCCCPRVRLRRCGAHLHGVQQLPVHDLVRCSTYCLEKRVC